MRARLVTLFALLVVVTAVTVAPVPAAGAPDRPFAQDVGEEEEELVGEEEEAEGQEGGGEAETEGEVGAGEGETEGAAEETGPPWTYQMARLGMVLLVVLGLAIGLAYWRLVAKRQRLGV
jgi:hypothetical protein